MPWVFFVAATAAAALAHATIIPKTYSNPWISIIIDGEQKRVLLSPMTQGIVLFQDIAAAEQKHRSSQVSVAFNGHSVQTMIKIVRRPPHLHVPWTVDGVIGVGIKSTRTELLWPYVNGSDPNSMQYTYSGMDYATGAASLQFGPSSDTILWSEPMNTVDDFYYQRFTSFPMYQVSVCGKSVTEATSSYWDAVVDFRSPCLTLPKEFYATLLAWAPLSYNATVNLTVVRPGVAAADLPTLRFQLSHFSPLLSLPLASFVLPGNATLLRPTYLCIQPGHSVKHVVGNHWAYPDIDDQGDVFTNPLDDNMRVPNMYRSPIVLGTMALQSLGLVVHAKHTRVGFHRPSPPPSNVSVVVEDTCNRPAVCVGHQTFRSNANKCSTPNCDRRFYHILDHPTQTCIVNPWWQVVGVALVGLCSLYEVYFDVITQRFSRDVVATNERS